MPTKRESVCCYEIKQLGSLLEDPHIEILSILYYTACRLYYICLHRAVFTVSFYVHQHRYEDVEVPADEIILLLLCLV